ncbi:CidA/LrgA family protein [Verrucomicrobium spinosum]|uniref:CidA/LrgA family protein n=1 Tax=Verrucomicrobium spinosum TaxID=2736 RepID=UPI0001744D78|nr:CidA/LrgA family protein [Verrucomicrobium spinosum]
MRQSLVLLQCLVLVAFWLAGEMIVKALHLPVPGSVLGFFGLLSCLLFRWIPVSWVQYGSTGMLKHLSLFFVPAMLAVVKYKELVSLDGVKLVLATIAGTLTVMIGTALVVEASLRWRVRHGDGN